MWKYKGHFLSIDRLAQYALFALVACASLISHTWLPFSPNMFCWLFALIAVIRIYSVDIEDTFRIPKSQKNILVLPFFFIAYILFSQYAMRAPFSRYMGVFVAISFFVLFVLLQNRQEKKNSQNYIDSFVLISFFIYVFEAVARYSVNIYNEILGQNIHNWIYKFKFAGPMYMESNGTAIHLLVLMFFTLWWSGLLEGREISLERKLVLKKRYKKLLIGFGLLLLLTISRACILAMIAGLYYYYFFRGRSRRFQTLSIFLGFTALILLISYLYSGLMKDFSFSSKFEIYDLAMAYFKQANIWQYIFGIGLSRSQEVMGFYAHNFFLVYLVETGIIGFLLLCSLFLQFIISTKGTALVVLIPFIIGTASSTVTYLPDLYLVMGIMYFYRDILDHKMRMI